VATCYAGLTVCNRPEAVLRSSVSFSLLARVTSNAKNIKTAEFSIGQDKLRKKAYVVISLACLTLIGIVVVPAILFRLRHPNIFIDGKTRTQVIDTLIARLDQHYVVPNTAKQIEMLLLKRQHNGEYEKITNGEHFAAQLSSDMASIAHDLHLQVNFSRAVVPPDREANKVTNSVSQMSGGQPSSLAIDWLSRLTRSINKYGVDNVDHLDHAIGYLQITGFPPPSLVAENYASAMDKLSDTDALIIDVRNNHGGSPRSVALLISYFVEHRTRLNDIWSRDSGLTTQIWTDDKLDGRRYGSKKPVVILAGPDTKSAGEDFTYTMQTLKRATVIGERTWGGAHPTASFRLSDHFYVAIPNRRSVSPITHTNWEGTGVRPDVIAKPANGLAVAKSLLQQQLGANIHLSPENDFSL
jgi:hypothetical protein